MSKDLTYKLSMAEIAPPALCWKQIEDRLNAEYNLSDSNLSSRLTDTEVSPPVLAWQNIQPYLADIGRQSAKVIPINFKRIAVAASILGLIGFAGWYIFMSGNNSGSQNEISVTNAVGSVIAPKKTEKTLPSAKPPKEKIGNQTQETGRNKANEKAITAGVIRKPVIYRKIIPAKVGAVPSVPEISIQAPPIRDVDGKLIMDVNLLRSSGADHYITVTGPNGQQTRISDKFLNMIHYLNAQDNDNNQDPPDRQKWKERIKEWRSRLLEQAGYFPANNHFMGIMDLKELIQDK